jgi:hypothetical protein
LIRERVITPSFTAATTSSTTRVWVSWANEAEENSAAQASNSSIDLKCLIGNSRKVPVKAKILIFAAFYCKLMRFDDGTPVRFASAIANTRKTPLFAVFKY